MVTENPAEHASVLMKKGIALLNSTTRQAWAESLVYFNEALAIRRALPSSPDSWPAYVLAASWMNRGDALTKLGESENLHEAVRCFDEALAVLATISIDANPLYRRRLAIAWINRGLALQEQGTEKALAEARESFERGIEVLKDRADQKEVVAGGWMNRANVLMRFEPPSLVEARESAERAVSLAVESEESDLGCAETALKARHVLCQALAQCLIDGDTRRSDHAVAAKAAVEAALKVIRTWEEKGETCFRSQGAQMFRFGVTLVQEYLPDQLASFIEKGLPALGTCGDLDVIGAHATAVEALAAAWRAFEKEGFVAINTPRRDQWIETLRVLRSTDSRLRELRAAAVAGERYSDLG